MINITIIHKSYFDCFQDCMISILEYYGKEFMLAFG